MMKADIPSSLGGPAKSGDITLYCISCVVLADMMYNSTFHDIDDIISELNLYDIEAKTDQICNTIIEISTVLNHDLWRYDSDYIPTGVVFHE